MNIFLYKNETYGQINRFSENFCFQKKGQRWVDGSIWTGSNLIMNFY